MLGTYLPDLPTTLEGIWKLLNRKSSFTLQILARELRTPLYLPCDLAGNATKESKRVLKSSVKAEGGMRKVLPATPTWDCLGSTVLPISYLQGTAQGALCLLVKSWG